MDKLTHIFNLKRNNKRHIVTNTVRKAILESYDHTCQHCNGASGQAASRIDHIIPISPRDEDFTKIASMSIKLPEESLDCLENLTASCHPCNASKSNLILPEEKIQSLQVAATQRIGLITFFCNGIAPKSKPSSEYLSKEQIEILKLTQILDEEIIYDNKWSKHKVITNGYRRHQQRESLIDNLIAKGADIYALGEAGIIWAAAHRKENIIKDFLKTDIHHIYLKKAFVISIYQGYPDIAELFPNICKGKKELNKLLDITVAKQEDFNFSDGHNGIIKLLYILGANKPSDRTLRENPYDNGKDNQELMLSIINDEKMPNRLDKIQRFSKLHKHRLRTCFLALLEKENFSENNSEAAHALLKKDINLSHEHLTRTLKILLNNDTAANYNIQLIMFLLEKNADLSQCPTKDIKNLIESKDF